MEYFGILLADIEHLVTIELLPLLALLFNKELQLNWRIQNIRDRTLQKKMYSE